VDNGQVGSELLGRKRNMAMELSGEVQAKDYTDLAEGGFLHGLDQYVTKMMELHDNPAQDDGYLYIIWVDADKISVHDFCGKINENVAKQQGEHDDTWEYRVRHEDLMSIALVYTWV